MITSGILQKYPLYSSSVSTSSKYSVIPFFSYFYYIISCQVLKIDLRGLILIPALIYFWWATKILSNSVLSLRLERSVCHSLSRSIQNCIVLRSSAEKLSKALCVPLERYFNLGSLAGCSFPAFCRGCRWLNVSLPHLHRNDLELLSADLCNLKSSHTEQQGSIPCRRSSLLRVRRTSCSEKL